MARKTAEQVFNAQKKIDQNADQFSKSINELLTVMEGDISQVLVAQSLEFWNEVTKETPFKTGRARANWQIGKTVNDKMIDEGKPQPPPGNITNAVKVWLFNNLPYIEQLEAGSSIQAPQGMVALAALKLAKHLSEEARKLGYIK